jgi:hypothetical protein
MWVHKKIDQVKLGDIALFGVGKFMCNLYYIFSFSQFLAEVTKHTRYSLRNKAILFST